MKILIDAVAATSGGGFSRVRELARSLPRLGPQHRCLFVLQPAVAAIVREIAPMVEIVEPPAALSRPPARLVWEHLWLPLLARRFQSDVVFSPFNIAPTHWPAPRPRVAVIVSNLAPYSPVVRSMYSGKGALRLEMLRRLTDRTLERADWVFLLSRQGFALIDEPLLDGKAEVIPMAPPPVLAAERPGGLEIPSEPYFVVVTDMFRYKGVELVAEALALLEPSQRPLVLVCGRPEERDYVEFVEAEVERLGITGRIRLVGARPHGEVLALIDHSRGCLCPSRFENLSRVPIEAMSVGCPVVAADIHSYREACNDAALYFDLDRPDQLARHIDDLARDDVVREKWAARGLAALGSVDASGASARILAALERL